MKEVSISPYLKSFVSKAEPFRSNVNAKLVCQCHLTTFNKSLLFAKEVFSSDFSLGKEGGHYGILQDHIPLRQMALKKMLSHIPSRPTPGSLANLPFRLCKHQATLSNTILSLVWR
jgi:hypothetical protein